MVDEPLPPNLELMIDLMGEAPALKLAEAKGGQRIYVPGELKPGHWLITVLGVEAAEALSKHFAGESIVVPQGPAGTLAQVQRMMRRRRADALRRGFSANQVAAYSGYSVRQVYRSRAADRRADAAGQGDLFKSDDEDTL